MLFRAVCSGVSKNYMLIFGKCSEIILQALQTGRGNGGPDRVIGCNQVGFLVKIFTDGFLQFLFHHVGAAGTDDKKSKNTKKQVQKYKISVQRFFHCGFTSNL